jgi:hypothetical protein
VTSSAGGLCLLEEPSGNHRTFEVGPGFFTVAANEASFLTESFRERGPETL